MNNFYRSVFKFTLTLVLSMLLFSPSSGLFAFFHILLHGLLLLSIWFFFRVPFLREEWSCLYSQVCLNFTSQNNSYDIWFTNLFLIIQCLGHLRLSFIDCLFPWDLVIFSWLFWILYNWNCILSRLNITFYRSCQNPLEAVNFFGFVLAGS